jgi:hypothetical protein
MQKRSVAFLCAIISAAIIAASFSAPAKAVNWKAVTTVTGSGSQTTAEFSISGSEWRINWSYAPNSQAPSLTVFSFFVYSHGGNPVDHVIRYGASETSGTLSIHEGPKPYYITIEAANTPSYTITVEYDADSTVSGSLLAAIIAAVIAIPTIIIIIMVLALRKKYKKPKPPTTQPPPPPPPPT